MPFFAMNEYAYYKLSNIACEYFNISPISISKLIKKEPYNGKRCIVKAIKSTQHMLTFILLCYRLTDPNILTDYGF